ncbi:unnamed protein product [Mytilus coruscus]|uniref:ZMYM2-like/QRICH1 C-terminal domain-containing protein n=1 Tax=Mytilus coruscus TaxID=42192 RepID=A0A6J8C311_MYTCO|nr:unnamed protein product [Mytilus coruscus]
MKELGLRNLPNAAEAIESDEEEELFSSGAFGTGNPDSLLAAIWYLNTIYFGLRGSHEHRQLKWGDITMGTEPNGTKKLTYNERLTKTRDGTNLKKKTLEPMHLNHGMRITLPYILSKVTKSEKAATAPNPDSNPESYINVEEIKTALNERPESTISSTVTDLSHLNSYLEEQL